MPVCGVPDYEGINRIVVPNSDTTSILLREGVVKWLTFLNNLVKVGFR